MTSKIDLLPCPFCGSDAKLIKADRPSYTPHSEGWYVMCKCGASLGFHGNDNEYNTYGDFPHELCAIQAWNTRMDERYVERRECRMLPTRDKPRSKTLTLTCSECAHWHEYQGDKREFHFCPNCGAKAVNVK